MRFSKLQMGFVFGGLLLAALLTILLWPKKVVSFRDFAQCLTQKNVTMYGSDTCVNCLNQKNIFGESFQLIHYIKCDFEKEECAKKTLRLIPCGCAETKCCWALNPYLIWQRFRNVSFPPILLKI